MRGAVNRFVLLVVDALDDVSLLAHAPIWKDCVSRSKVPQVSFERTDVSRRTGWNILTQIERGGDLLHRVESCELPNPHTHGVARMDETVRAGQDAAILSIRIGRRPISSAFDFAGLNRAVADRGSRQESVGECYRVNERFKRRANLP